MEAVNEDPKEAKVERQPEKASGELANRLVRLTVTRTGQRSHQQHRQAHRGERHRDRAEMSVLSIVGGRVHGFREALIAKKKSICQTH